MMYSVKIAPGADKVLAKWKKSNPQLFKKFRKIYHELMDHRKRLSKYIFYSSFSLLTFATKK